MVYILGGWSVRTDSKWSLSGKVASTSPTHFLPTILSTFFSHNTVRTFVLTVVAPSSSLLLDDLLFAKG